MRILSSTRFFTTAVVMLLTLFVKNVNADTRNIDLADLGQYQFSFEKLISVNKITGNKVLAQVTEKEGSDHAMNLPFNVQKINFLVANGQWVQNKQAVARLSGKDVHHFFDEYEAAKQLFTITDHYYQSSLKLFNNKAIKQSQWLEISENYFTAKLNLEHINHFMSPLTVTEDEEVIINAPLAGYIRFSTTNIAKQEGQLLFDVIPSSAIRLKVKLSKRRAQLVEFTLDDNDCRFAVDTIEKTIKNFNVTVWSEAVKSSCQLMLGDSVVVTPVYQQTAFSINKEAVFEFENKNYIAIKKQQKVSLVAINILGSTTNSYLINADSLLDGQEALVSSVSAIQGVLLELGGE